jgi:hypothetical protein
MLFTRTSKLVQKQLVARRWLQLPSALPGSTALT